MLVGIPEWIVRFDRRLVKSFLHLASSLVISKLFLVIAIAYGARILGPIQWGIFSYAFNILFTMHILGDFGFHTLIMREAAKGQLTKSVFSQIVLSRFFLGMVSFTVACMLVSMLHKKGDVIEVLVVLGLSILLRPLYSSVRSLTQGLEQSQWTTVLDAVLYGIFLLMVVIGLALFPHAALIPSIAWLVGVAGSAGVGILVYRHSCSTLINERDKHVAWVRLLRMAAPFFMINVIVVIFHRVDVLMLEQMRGYEEVGYYSAAYQIFDALALFPGIMITVLFPRMVKRRELPKSEINKMLIGVVSLPIAFCIIAASFSKNITSIVFGDSYDATASLIPILVLGLPFMAATGVLAHALISKHRTGVSSVATGISLCVNIVLNWIYIPEFGMLAAAWTTAISLFVNFFLHWLAVMARAERGSLTKSQENLT